MNTNELTIWAAGFFDGEGNISIGKPGGKATGYRLVVKVAQKKDAPLKLLKRQWGGSLWKDERYDVWQWQVCSENAFEFLSDVLPYLQVKKKQAMIAIKFQTRRGPRFSPLTDSQKARDHQDYVSIRQLNRPGITVT